MTKAFESVLEELKVNLPLVQALKRIPRKELEFRLMRRCCELEGVTFDKLSKNDREDYYKVITEALNKLGL